MQSIIKRLSVIMLISLTIFNSINWFDIREAEANSASLTNNQSMVAVAIGLISAGIVFKNQKDFNNAVIAAHGSPAIKNAVAAQHMVNQKVISLSKSFLGAIKNYASKSYVNTGSEVKAGTYTAPVTSYQTASNDYKTVDTIKQKISGKVLDMDYLRSLDLVSQAYGYPWICGGYCLVYEDKNHNISRVPTGDYELWIDDVNNCVRSTKFRNENGEYCKFQSSNTPLTSTIIYNKIRENYEYKYTHNPAPDLSVSDQKKEITYYTDTKAYTQTVEETIPEKYITTDKTGEDVINVNIENLDIDALVNKKVDEILSDKVISRASEQTSIDNIAQSRIDSVYLEKTGDAVINVKPWPLPIDLPTSADKVGWRVPEGAIDVSTGQVLPNVRDIPIDVTITRTLADGTTITSTRTTTLDTTKILPPPVVTTDKINWDKLKQAGLLFTTKFPFSLPFDLYNAMKLLVAEPKKPNWNFTINSGQLLGTIHLNMQDTMDKFDPLIQTSRKFMLLLFVIGLIMITRKLLGGAV